MIDKTAKRKPKHKTIKPTFEVRFVGPGISPELISLSHVSEALSAIQDLASGRDRYETSQVPHELSMGLVDVASGSAVYMCVHRAPDEALTHLRMVRACLANEDVEPEAMIAALPPLESLSNVARLNKCRVDVTWRKGRRETLFSVGQADYGRLASNLLIEGETSVAGTLQRVGGATDTKCALRVEGRRHLLYCDVASNDLARRLGKHLYEEIVVSGTAVWLHQSWRIYKFNVTDFSQPRLADPATMISEFRDAGLKAWDDVDDPEVFVRGAQ